VRDPERTILAVFVGYPRSDPDMEMEQPGDRHAWESDSLKANQADIQDGSQRGANYVDPWVHGYARHKRRPE
jgi:hypothetical protein